MAPSGDILDRWPAPGGSVARPSRTLHFGSSMVRLKIVDILETSPVDPEGHLDPERVEGYRRSIDLLDPVVVFETEDGLLLADGYHRIAAAVREGRATIEGEVRKGS